MSFLVFALVLFFYHLSVAKRFEALEQKVKELSGVPSQSQTESVTHPISLSANDTLYPAGTFVPVPESAHHHLVKDEPNHFFVWIKQDFLVKVGALLLLIAFGWIVSYAFANNWIGPAGRIALGLLTGVAFMALGIVRIEKVGQQGSIFTVLGSTIILLTTFAAREMYGFFTPVSALVIMFLSVVLVAFVSVRYNRPRLALAGLILGAVAPFLTSSPESDIVTLSLYLLMLVVGTLWVVKITRAPALTPAALIVVGLYNLLYVDSLSFEDEIKGLLFAFVFTAIFFVSNILSLLYRSSNDLRQSHIVTALGTGLFLIVWIMSAAPAVWQTPLYLLWLLVFTAGAFVIYSKTSERIPFYIYSAVSVGLLGAATANEFSGAILTIVFTLEITALSLVARYVLRAPAIARRASLLFVVPLLLSFEHFDSSAWQNGFLHSDFIALAILTVGLLLTASSLYEARGESEKNQTDTATTLFAVGAIYVLTLIWLVLHSIMSPDSATTVSLIIYTILGLFMYIRGRQTDHTAFVMTGRILLGGVVLRLLFVDVWEMALVARIITFIIIGVLLLSTAFIKKNHTANISE